FIHEPPVLSELRPHIWQDTVKIVQDFPVWGTGLGTFSHIFSHYRDFAIELGFLRYTHCDYLQLVSEMGIMGGIFLVLFIFYFIKLYVRVVRRLQ
ncbi:MAG: O-antigen ligase family protein, partial [Candidatus Omnitrophica bacterium]|nr:O-antigen ligase family protein [Candidatus Omnitrophota bacterium]